MCASRMRLATARDEGGKEFLSPPSPSSLRRHYNGSPSGTEAGGSGGGGGRDRRDSTKLEGGENSSKAQLITKLRDFLHDSGLLRTPGASPSSSPTPERRRNSSGCGNEEGDTEGAGYGPEDGSDGGIAKKDKSRRLTRSLSFKKLTGGMSAKASNLFKSEEGRVYRGSPAQSARRDKRSSCYEATAQSHYPNNHNNNNNNNNNLPDPSKRPKQPGRRKTDVAMSGGLLRNSGPILVESRRETIEAARHRKSHFLSTEQPKEESAAATAAADGEAVSQGKQEDESLNQVAASNVHKTKKKKERKGKSEKQKKANKSRSKKKKPGHDKPELRRTVSWNKGAHNLVDRSGNEKTKVLAKEKSRSLRNIFQILTCCPPGTRLAFVGDGLFSMLVTKKDREEVYQYLFKEGVMVARKDFKNKHSRLDVPNIVVLELMRSFVSRSFVKEQYAWRHYYWYLTNEGIEYLRTYLHLPAEIVPSTLKKTTRAPQTQRPAEGERPPRMGQSGCFPQMASLPMSEIAQRNLLF